ncbi:AAA family ATPase [Cronbergia sp. UHCC 0137]|uniref:AAA family ATPase n=1 Tax=Cronbergia sp. UHCC 0137 TaxID=3110239 RepID=UPI002B20D3E6|nr:AAA family ATPase [Cronbergia sp. UHCC 0137]MEA5618394.1 AAA family ATPase [Cronbergia sp. UHCC 0137]
MLKKILHIKNVGLFKDATCTSPAFNKVTLIYAENGRGKSTLASILRSCATNDTASISSRKTVDSDNAPEIKLFFDNGTSRPQPTFDGITWSCSYPDILVFDTEFINKNVYSGTEIAPNHRQGLLEFALALGEDAVQLKQKVENETQKASERGKEITIVERELNQYRGEMTLVKFADLESDPNVDEKINSLEKRFTTAKNRENLQRKASPELLREPQFNLEAFFKILSTTLEDIEKNAEETVSLHIAKHSDTHFENWLSQGQAFGSENNCPYCGQAIKNSDLIMAYKTHFNQAYKDIKFQVANLSLNIERRLSDAVVQELFVTVEKNQSIANEWTEHINIDSQKSNFDRDQLLCNFGEIRDLFNKLAQAKQQNPLESIGSDAENYQAISLWDKILFAVNTYNQSIRTSIDEIAVFKANLAGENIQQIQQEIEQLKRIKVRQEQNVCDLIQKWNDAKEAKKLHEIQKANARSSLDSLMTTTLEKYQIEINKLLEKFSALFQIEALRSDHVGGLPRSNYYLKVKDRDVMLSSDSAPSFSTALSEGDKRTLAFAFFMARLEDDPNLNKKIVVVDDPVCSLDLNRRNTTKTLLRNIGRKSAQLIVLGHDAYFLRDLRDDLKDRNVNISAQLLKINRVQNNYSNFSEFDIDGECASDYYKNYKSLDNFINNGQSVDVRTVARAIRPLLEGYLHRRFPGYVERRKLFGQIIGDVNVAPSTNPLSYLKPLVTELHEINDYAGKFHHDTNAAADTVHISDGELRSYAIRALNVIHKGTLNNDR